MLKYAVLFYFLFVQICFAQDLKFEHYNDTYGLSHNSVRHIVQDDNGFLWLGTFGGLNRFDGYQFTSYLSDDKGSNSLLHDDVTALEFNSQTNNLWIGTRKGLTLLDLDKQKFTTFLPDQSNAHSLPDEEIRAVYPDRQNNVWVGTKTSGLFLFNPSEEKFIKIQLSGFEYVKEIFEDSKGNLWIGSFGNVGIAKISRKEDGSIEHIRYYNLPIPNSEELNPYINFIYEDAKGDLFAGTRKGLYKFDGETNSFTNLYIEDPVIREKLGPYFLSVAKAPNGKYWLGTLGGLLVCEALEDICKGDFSWNYETLTDDSSITDNLIYSLYFDASGVLWIGTEDGLDKYDPYVNEFKISREISKFINGQAPRIRGFASTYDDKVIVATWHNGLFTHANDGVKPLNGIKENIASIYSADGIHFYCGLWDGRLLVYNYKTGFERVIDVGFKNAPILSILKYDNTLVIGSFGEGIRFINASSFTPSDIEPLLPDYDINKIKKYKDEIWVATEAGVVAYNLKTAAINKYEQITSHPEMPYDNVSDILIDEENNTIWAATRLGLARYDAKKDHFSNQEIPKSLTNRWVTDIVATPQGDLWLNQNNNSIAKYNIAQNTTKIYNVRSGNRLDIFSSNGFFNFNNESIYLAGKDGIIYFTPYQISENLFSPKPIITEFKVQNKEIIPGTKIDGHVPLQEDINKSKKVKLQYANRSFSIQFATPSFTNERLNKFQYKLEGFDKDWIETGSDVRTVQYTNLYPGDYIFKLRASNSNGIWSETSEYNIEVDHPFWLSFKGVLLILFFIGILFYFIRKQVKIRIALKRELLLEKVKRERDEKLNNDKLRFFTNISHELRTPLTLILGPVKQILDLNNQDEYLKSRANLIYQNANRLLRLVNQILDFRRAETGELKLRVRQSEILVSTRNIFNSFLEMAHAKSINLNLNVEEEQIICWIDMDKYKKVLYNLMSNAIKFTNNQGNVDLYLSYKGENNEYLFLEISDDGIGIPPESQEKIFSRFYQAENSQDNTTGTGIGLSLVKALVEIHKGSIFVKSEPGKGSIFTVEIPIKKDAYNTEDIFDSVPKEVANEEFVPITQIENSFEPSVRKIDPVIKHKILILDDNAELRKYIAEYLSPFYKVYEAENGKEGLEICKNEKPILCVADVMMPVMDGFQFVEALKADENTSHIAVILLTALAENENRIKGYKIGVDGYLVKPFDPSLLKTRIENIIKIYYDLKQKFSGDEEIDILKLAHSQIDIDLITDIKALIDKNINNPKLTPSFISDAMAMSSSKIYRKIKQLTDVTPNELIRIIRLRKSIELLKTKNYNVSEVATMVGFNDPLYFSRCFKKQFGKSPSSFIK
ncbi:two-component regulator propeller domain-containing protein [Zunongwangia sp. HGR-M22]|uniref:two-component regulator propeller domain-containing protein n=1 Tax=Zunongwangia sp. HGR-M22 TaxID=3015168 RepID=UPI0022DDCA58|nr:two-component regulator propeller domain-containing protein [Zunongwangia sp. HGR-M22]WBL26412.1 ATP-binding protein [Zunongwangia sp. HGR-M22]